ncbi:MAG: alpha/beta fold hydrolase [Acidobacteria bacterium]|nr:alpha/beta fold hydrolase [Acidobacteriota bacterium]
MRTGRRSLAAGLALLATLTGACARQTGAPRLHERTIAGPDGGIRLSLRERRPADRARCGGRIALLLEPFGVPTAEAFDVPGYSWMQDLAGAGFDAWALDMRGFGRSTRPAAMSEPPGRNPPAVRASEAVRDVAAAVAFLRKECDASRVDVIGWSWGAVVAGMYAADHPEAVRKLVLYGAMHGFDLPWMTEQFEDPARPGRLNPAMPAYQVVPPAALTGHWDMMLARVTGPAGKDLRSPEALAAVTRVFLASDPSTPIPGRVRRPMGPLADLYSIWTGRPIYDASAIRASTLLVRGDRDQFADPSFLDRLTGAAERREVVVGDATHWLLYERNRDQLLREVRTFLSEP